MPREEWLLDTIERMSFPSQVHTGIPNRGRTNDFAFCFFRVYATGDGALLNKNRQG